jgi:hypothetical protein
VLYDVTHQTAGAAAAHGNEKKRRQYRRQGSTGYLFVPLTLETSGRLGKPLMRLLGSMYKWLLIGVRASSSSNSSFRELLPLPIKCDAGGVARFFVKASGIAIKHGLTRPSADVSDLD